MNKTGNSQILNLTLIIAIAFLIVLIIYANKFQSSVDKSPAEPVSPGSQTGVPEPQPAPLRPASGHNARSPYTLAPQAESPLAGVKHPDEQTAVTNTFPYTPDDPRVIQTLVEKQARDLSRETAAQGMQPEDKRPLALTPERIRKLKESGNLIY